MILSTSASPVALGSAGELLMGTPKATPQTKPRRQSDAYKQRVAARRRERKAEGRPPRQRLAEETIQSLQAVLDRIPPGDEFDEWRADVNRTIRRIRKSGKRTPELVIMAIVEALGKPFNRDGATVDNLADDTEVPKSQVQETLDRMLAVGTVNRAPKEVPTIARGATIWLYFLTRK
jgi:hypothetical protein